MNKPREWWISFWTYSGHKEVNAEKPSLTDPTRTDVLVIEKSAFDVVVKERDSLNECCRQNEDSLSELETERDTLAVQLAEAEEIIYQIANARDGSEHGNNQYIAKEYFKLRE